MRTLLIAFLALTSVASAQTEYEISTSDWSAATYIGHRDTVAIAELSSFFGEYMPAAFQAVLGAGLAPAGSATGLYWSYDETVGTTDVAVAVAFEGEQPDNLPDGFEIIKVADAQVLSTDFYGSYDGLSEAHEAIDAYMQAEEIETAFLVVEEYITNPQSEPDSSKWLTRIHYLVAH